MSVIEALSIRFLWLLYALSFKRRPGLCPPTCNDCHTWKFPCRAR